MHPRHPPTFAFHQTSGPLQSDVNHYLLKCFLCGISQYMGKYGTIDPVVFENVRTIWYKHFYHALRAVWCCGGRRAFSSGAAASRGAPQGCASSNFCHESMIYLVAIICNIPSEQSEYLKAAFLERKFDLDTLERI